MARKKDARIDLDSLTIDDLGPIKHADLKFGDLTLLVGQQATGKSIVLATLKLLLDAPRVRHELIHAGVVWNKDTGRFFDAYYGTGMKSLLSDSTKILRDGKAVDFSKIARLNKNDDQHTTRAFVIPAQRVMSIRDGRTQWFTQFAPGDPYMLRAFSDEIHQMMMSDQSSAAVFPRPQRLNAHLRDLAARHIFGGFQLTIDEQGNSQRFALRQGDTLLPYLVWSAGQREFVPLLLGLYHLMPAGKVSRRDTLRWAIIEEPEMGLHPTAVIGVFLMILNLMQRGYRVVVSTHSPTIAAAVWALNALKSAGGSDADIRALFDIGKGIQTNELSRALLKADYKVYLLRRNGASSDVSALDPESDNVDEAMLGTLDEFSVRAVQVVAEANASVQPSNKASCYEEY
jgi:hypothetical protein